MTDIVKTEAIKCAKWRIEHGITQADIAVRCGLSTPSVCRFECGMRDSLTTYLAYIAMGYNPRGEVL